MVELTEEEQKTVRDLINDWGFEYSLRADRDEVIALAKKLKVSKAVLATLE